MESRTLVLLHGAGGPIDADKWLGALNRRLESSGVSTINPEHDQVVAPQYLDSLMTGDLKDEPKNTWRRPDQKAFIEARLRYADTVAALSQGLRFEEAQRRGPHWGHIPETALDLAADGVIRGWPEIRRYAFDRGARWAAQAAVLSALPSARRVVIVAHSLGTVVAVDLLKKLPPSMNVDLLLTLGSPLAIGRLGVEMDVDDFPVDRVGAWINLYDPSDLVTTGRGAGRRFPSAGDLQIRTNRDHDALAYTANPVVGEVLGRALFGQRCAPTGSEPARRIHPAWNPLLLQFAFSGQVSRQCKGDDWKLKARVDRARHVLATRAAEEAQRLNLSRGSGSSPLGEEDPVAPSRRPSEQDLLVHAGDLVEGSWSDEELLAPGVGLLASSPFYPFGIRIDDKRQRAALLATLNLIRRRRGSVSDQEMADAIVEGVAKGRQAVAEDRFPWEGVLIGAGVGLLALTGVGLVAAVPAGLAGAAAMTSALAAFGPGGMAGGIATIAALTGTGAAFTGAGMGIGATDRPADARQELRLTSDELVGLPSPELRRAVAGALAVVWVQRKLEKACSALRLRRLLQDTLDAVLVESRLHEELAEGSPETKDWIAKRDVLVRALKWLHQEGFLDDPSTRVQIGLLELPESVPSHFQAESA